MKKSLIFLLCLLLTLAGFTLSGAQAASPEEDMAAAVVAEALSRQKDAWVVALLETEIGDVSVSDGVLSFTLGSFSPDPSSLGSYAKSEDRAAWRGAMLENIRTGRLTFSVALGKDGTVTKKTVNDFIDAIRKESGVVKRQYTGKDVSAALEDLFFCAPTDDKKISGSGLLIASEEFAAFIAARPDAFPCENAAEWAPLFHAQRNVKLSFKNGPHAVRMTWDGVNPETLLDYAYDLASAELSSAPKDRRLSRENLPVLWRGKLAEASVELTKKRLASQSAVIDLAELAEGRLPADYTAYVARYQPDDSFRQLDEGYDLLPDAAAVPLPKTGTLNYSAKKGRSVTVRVPKDGRNTYVQLRDADTNVIVSDAIIAPGKVVNLKVPESFYSILYASGSTWYGPETLFGPLGTYLKSSDFSVAKKKWTLTASQETEGITLDSAVPEDFAPVEDKSIHIQGILEPDVPLLESYPENHPVIAGVSSTTGLPASGEPYTPVVMVLDNAEEAYPHWGISQADIIFQVPNAGSGVTKLLALFADHYPDQAGPVRSGRASMLPLAMSFNAAFAYGGPPAYMKGNVDIDQLMRNWKMSTTHRTYNLLHDNGFKERIKGKGSHNLSCIVSGIHENLIRKEVEFEERPFLFTDETRTDGQTANIIRVLHRGEDKNGASNSASRAVFRYDPATGQYTRTNSSGKYIDRNTGENVTFANVIVLRVRFNWEVGHVYLNRHLTGAGSIEIFQDGRYVRGAWKRENESSRLILIDADGSELELHRGKTFIVVTNDVSDVIYTE